MAGREGNKDSQMARNLVKAGYPHGRVMGGPTQAPPIPPRGDVGSAAYRRRRKQK